MPNLTSELFTLQPHFAPIQTTHTVPNNNNAWGGKTANTQQHTCTVCVCVFGMADRFVLLINFSSSLLSRCHGYVWITGDLLKPSPPTQIHSPGAQLHSGKMLPNDLDSSLANLVGSEYKHDSSSSASNPAHRFRVASSLTSYLFPLDLQFGGTPAKK